MIIEFWLEYLMSSHSRLKPQNHSLPWFYRTYFLNLLICLRFLLANRFETDNFN